MNQNFKTNDISLAAYLLTQGVSLVNIVADHPNYFTFILADLDSCKNLKRQFLNGGTAPAQQLFSKREMLIAEIKNHGNVAEGATVMRVPDDSK